MEAGVALFLVIVLVTGMAGFVATFLQAALAVELLGYRNAISLISTTIDIVLYLFVLIELFRAIVACVEAQKCSQGSDSCRPHCGRAADYDAQIR